MAAEQKRAQSIPELLAAEAWEALPEHGNAPSMAEALAEKRGVCVHRSIIIGRRLRALGLTSMRRVNFGADNIPIHFCNYFRLPDTETWMYISTANDPGGFTVGTSPGFDEAAFYASFGGLGFEKLEPGGWASQASAMILPELSMGLFADCVLAQQYLRKAYRLLG